MTNQEAALKLAEIVCLHGPTRAYTSDVAAFLDAHDAELRAELREAQESADLYSKAAGAESKLREKAESEVSSLRAAVKEARAKGQIDQLGEMAVWASFHGPIRASNLFAWEAEARAASVGKRKDDEGGEGA